MNLSRVESDLRGMFPTASESTYELWKVVQMEYLRRNSFDDWRLLSTVVLLCSPGGKLDEAHIFIRLLIRRLTRWSEGASAVHGFAWWQWAAKRRARRELCAVTNCLLSMLFAMASLAPRAYSELVGGPLQAVKLPGEAVGA
jgi:hypothetical protein